jgi:hypothetical protein
VGTAVGRPLSTLRSRLTVGGMALLWLILSCSADRVTIGVVPPPPPPAPPGGGGFRDTTGVPLNDLVSWNYSGFAGGLYPDRSSAMPAEHSTTGITRGRAIVRLDANGNPSANGKYVFLSIGMSNTSNEFCGVNKTTQCDPTTFMPAAAADPSVNHSALVIVNGAQGGEDASDWDTPADTTYDVVRDQRLKARGVTEKQVEVVWLKQADSRPSVSLPAADADAYRLEVLLGHILRSLMVHYPNLKQVFLSSRTYGGYAESNLNPEPFAFESGLSVKWIVQAQIDQMRTGQVSDSRAGDLNYNSVAPWIAWGPYLWANGTIPRSDGLIWVRSDFNADGTHPSASGSAKVAAALLQFFKTSRHTKCWFVTGGVCE